MHRSAHTVAAVILALGTAACGAATPGEEGSRAQIELRDFEIDAPASAPAGTVVTVENAGASRHNWTADDGSFATADLGPGEQDTVTLDETGSVAYRCTIHPDIMTGSIEVTG